jgi:hypothetical protein
MNIVVPKGKTLKLTVTWGGDPPGMERAFDAYRNDNNQHLMQANSLNAAAFTPTHDGVATLTWKAEEETQVRLESGWKEKYGVGSFDDVIFYLPSMVIAPGGGDVHVYANKGPDVYVEHNPLVARVAWTIS